MAEDNGQGANSEPEQQSGGMLKDPQSRRRFLRAAAIGTAGVAGVAGLAGVAQATGAPKILRHAFGAPDSHISGGSSLEGFFEGTAAWYLHCNLQQHQCRWRDQSLYHVLHIEPASGQRLLLQRDAGH